MPGLRLTKEETRAAWPKGTRVDVMAGGSTPQARGVVIGYGHTPGDIRVKIDHRKTPETWMAHYCRKERGA